MGLGWAIFAFAFAAVGGWQTWATLRRMRSPAPPPDVLASLRQDPPSAWQEHPAAAVAIGLHIGAVFALAATLTLDLALRDRGPTLFNVPAVAFLGYAAGTLGIVPLAQRAIRPVPVHIAPWGVVESGGTFRWERFGTCDLDVGRGVIRLRARRHPWLPIVMWHLPDGAEFARAANLIALHMPGVSLDGVPGLTPVANGEARARRRARAIPPASPGAGPAALILATAALVLPPVIVGVALALLGASFLTGYAALAAFALIAAWNPFFSRFTT
jgi:hypothetical protein